MDLVGDFTSLSLRASNATGSISTNENGDRPRSPLRPGTPTLKRFFSPYRPPSPRPFAPQGASRLSEVHGTPKRKKFGRRSRLAIRRRLVFDPPMLEPVAEVGTSTSASAFDHSSLLSSSLNLSSMPQPQMTSSPMRINASSPYIVEVDSALASSLSLPSTSAYSTQPASSTSSLFDLLSCSSSSLFQFSSTRSSSAQTEPASAAASRYVIDVDPNLIRQRSTSQSVSNANSSNIENSHEAGHCFCHPSASFYKRRHRRTRSGMSPGGSGGSSGSGSTMSMAARLRCDAAVQATSTSTGDFYSDDREDANDSIDNDGSNGNNGNSMVDNSGSTLGFDADRQNQSLLAALECPVCYSYCLPPVNQCRWGHVICNLCLPRCLPACPVCRTSGPGAFVRSIALDTIANELTFPCRFVDAGCSMRNLAASDKLTHELGCPFKFSPQR